MSKNTVPADLATMGAALLAGGFVLNGGTYTHPDKPAWRLNVSYTYREATLIVCVKNTDTRRWDEVGRYRGEHPLTWAKTFYKIFGVSPDSDPEQG